MKSTGIPQVTAVLATLALSLSACVNEADPELPLDGAEPTVAAEGPSAPAARPDRQDFRQGKLDKMKRHFEEADQNGDGKVTRAELEAASAARFKAADANGDGLLSADELTAMKSKHHGDRIKQLDKNGDGAITKDEAPPRMQSKFDEFDADGDGKISLAEMSQVRKSRPGKDRGNLIERLDDDGDGFLSPAEFSQVKSGWFERADADGDGAISLKEMQSSFKGKMGRRGEWGKGGGPGRGPGPGMEHLKAADANNDGQITRAEIEAYRGAKFDEIDKDGNGVLSAEEHAAMRGSWGGKGKPGNWDKQGEGKRGKGMMRGDADGDGKITKAEFVAASDRMLERLDTNGDDIISADELANVRTRFGKGMNKGRRGGPGPGPAGQ